MYSPLETIYNEQLYRLFGKTPFLVAKLIVWWIPSTLFMEDFVYYALELAFS